MSLRGQGAYGQSGGVCGEVGGGGGVGEGVVGGGVSCGMGLIYVLLHATD